MEKRRIAVIFGGCSSEHEISRLSAKCVVENISKEKYDVILVGIDKAGRWFLTDSSTEDIASGAWEQNPNNRVAFLSPDRSVRGLVVMKGCGACETVKLDLVFPVLHGKNGEDGTIQGLFQMAGIPFVGCGTSASAVCMDKAIAHTLLTGARIKQANYLWFFACNYSGEGIEKIKRKVEARLGYPVFVKPANAGSSVGVSKVEREEDLDTAVSKAAREDSKVVIEECIVGQEVECAVMGNDVPKSSIVGEIAPSADFYDYDDKYKNGTSQLYIPAHLAPEVSEELRHTAERAYRLLGCTGLARVDFFVRGGTEVLLNELNTLPGFTSISMYPKLWEACGVPIPDLLDQLIQLAFEKEGRM